MSAIRLKQEVFAGFQAALGLVVASLVLAGISGTIYKVISPDGWIAQAFGRSLSVGVAALGSLTLILGLAWFSRGWSSPPHRTRASDCVVYGFAAAGLVYVVRLWLEGSL